MKSKMMKRLCVVVGMLVACSMAGELKDSRDGKTYKTTKIGDQVWMAENLNYKTRGSICYDKKPENCEKYGRLYSWKDAMKACPTGWHLPSTVELEFFIKNVEELRHSLHKSWDDVSFNTLADSSNSLGFSALLAGYYCSDCSHKFSGLGDNTGFWSSWEGETGATYLSINHLGPNVGFQNKTIGNSVRCLQDSTDEQREASLARQAVADQNKGSMKDSRDGKTYKTTKIGDQIWMAENLNYKNRGSMCYGDNSANCKKYGRLYTSEAAMKACPTGWHLPSRDDFESLLSEVGKGASGRETSQNLRAIDYFEGTDKFGFSAISAGKYDSYNREYTGLGDPYTAFWASADDILDLGYKKVYVFKALNKNFGYAVRCLKDSN